MKDYYIAHRDAKYASMIIDLILTEKLRYYNHDAVSVDDVPDAEKFEPKAELNILKDNIKMLDEYYKALKIKSKNKWHL